MTALPASPAGTRNLSLLLMPSVATVFLCYLTVGIPLPVIPGQVHTVLLFGAQIVGWVIGSESLTTVLTRAMAGRVCDVSGPKAATLLGCLVCGSAGLFYLASSAAEASPGLSLSILLAGRIVLGLGESLIATGGIVWGIAIVGPGNAGKVMSWNGIAVYGALAVGAPLGVAIGQTLGFTAMSLVVTLLPLLAFLVCLFRPAVPAAPTGQRLSFLRVIGLVWLPGLGLALSTLGTGALTAFVTLAYAAKGWDGAGYALSAFGVFFILPRLFLGGLADRWGMVAALVSLVVEAAGQLLLWAAPNPFVALCGAALTGAGFTLLFPLFGVEAMRHVSPQSRGSAVGAFSAFYDVGVGLAGPGIGAIIGTFGYPSGFLAGAMAAAVAFLIAASLRRSLTG